MPKARHISLSMPSLVSASFFSVAPSISKGWFLQGPDSKIRAVFSYLSCYSHKSFRSFSVFCVRTILSSISVLICSCSAYNALRLTLTTSLSKGLLFVFYNYSSKNALVSSSSLYASDLINSRSPSDSPKALGTVSQCYLKRSCSTS